jgi:hypothetical protein
MNELIKWSSLQKSVSKLVPKKFFEIDPQLCLITEISASDKHTSLLVYNTPKHNINVQQ